MNKKDYTLGLHWMRHDLRVEDNEALSALTHKCDKVAVVYIFNPSWLKDNHYGHCHLGKHRHAFIDKSLVDVKEQLAHHNLSLIMLEGEPLTVLTDLLESAPFDCLSCETHYGYHEREQVSSLKARFSKLAFVSGMSNYLLVHENLPFPLDEMPNVFSPFRRKVEKNLSLRHVSANLDKSVRDAAKDVSLTHLSTYEPMLISKESDYSGGQSAGQQRIDDYFFKTDNIANYKETRNGLDGWTFSSRLSAYLANGCVSPAYIIKELKAYETQRVQNDSTYWLFFELLWREFFHLQSKKHGALFFQYGGIQQNPPANSFNATSFKQWKNGETPYPIVNACMHQLAATGFMSNRGRQLVASCFVHELQQDWRYGAAYFEEMLIDFDVASNYGNWQYLAGVGSDPRGHRQFNLEKQTDIYDPKRAFIKAWT